MGERSILRDKNLALFFTTGVSLKLWHEIGMIDREVAIYNELSKYFKHIYFLRTEEKTSNSKIIWPIT